METMVCVYMVKAWELLCNGYNGMLTHGEGMGAVVQWKLWHGYTW
jgi:hypothetical protein